MSFWYLATPYTKYPDGMGAAFVMACEQAALLVKAGIDVYSPIAHWHPIAVRGGIDKTDHEFWMRANKPMIALATGIVMVRASGWQSSAGMAYEVSIFSMSEKPIVEMDVGIIPPGLFP
jgi:glyoxylate carboligase